MATTHPDAAALLRRAANQYRANADQLDRLANLYQAATATTQVPADELRPHDLVVFPDGETRRVSSVGRPDWAQVLVEWADPDGHVSTPYAYPASLCFTVNTPRPPAVTDAELVEAAV